MNFEQLNISQEAFAIMCLGICVIDAGHRIAEAIRSLKK